MKKVTPIKLILADDHEIFLEGLSSVFQGHPRFEVLDTCRDGEHLLRALRTQSPDIVLTDLKMPNLSGVDAIARITKEYPAVLCLVVSEFDSEYMIIEAMNAGAVGYIMKSSPKKEIFDAVEQVYRGEEYYCRSTSEKLMRLALRNIRPAKNSKVGLFSNVEKQVIRLICEDKSVAEIADLLHVGTRTVEKHRSNISEKMNVTTVAGVAVYAVRHSLYFINGM